MQKDLSDKNLDTGSDEKLADYRNLLADSDIDAIENIIGDLGTLLVQKKANLYKETVAEINELVAKVGFSNIYSFLELAVELGLIDKPQDKSKKSISPRYIDPENAKNTWAGRGKKPLWLNQALANGATLADFDTLADGENSQRRVVEPRYIDPDNPANTWAGRGKKPLWVKEYLEQGFSLEDLKVKPKDESENDSQDEAVE
ncbi:H-NS histone family protein [Acinetobacter sp. ANC 5380]|uniref:H-NS histone family protein n=1 Tax=Acinetobacter terrae TaxID=2731247 RepID=A0A7Y2W9V8_9GAMM|nr:H-NS histone family protein [Acinetobacter terrae]NNH76519.1 H-NS histone family protein [Acinetobacter terrae]